MKIGSRSLISREGVARQWRVGDLLVEWSVERPPVSWLRLDVEVSVRWFSDE